MSSEEGRRDNIIYLGLPPWKKKLIIGISVFLLLLLTLLYLWKGYEVDDISVTGNKHYTVEQIRDMVMVGPLGRNSIWLVLKYRHRNMEDIPFIETMDVNMSSPHSISVTVYEKAIAGCVGYLDRYMYFDKDGMVVESSKVRHHDLPLVTGLNFDHVVLYEKLPVDNAEVFRSILTITQLLSKYNIECDQIYFSPDMEVTLYFDRARVQMGTLEDIDEKMNELNGLADKLKGLSGVLYLDSYVRKSGTGNITFQRDDVEQHEEITGTIPDPEAAAGEEDKDDGSGSAAEGAEKSAE